MIKIIIRFWNFIRVKNAIIYANEMHKLTKKRYYVLQIGGKIRVLTKTQIDYLVAKKVLRKSMQEYPVLAKMCLYHTV